MIIFVFKSKCIKYLQADIKIVGGVLVPYVLCGANRNKKINNSFSGCRFYLWSVIQQSTIIMISIQLAKAQVRNNIGNGTKKDNSNLNMSKVLMLRK